MRAGQLGPRRQGLFMTQRPGNQLFDAYFTARDMREVFCDQGRVQAMLDFESALARAEARVGLIPASAVAPIAAACDAGLYDFAALGEGLEVDAARMARNLELTQGLVLAEAVSIVLAQRVGRDTAHHLLEQCCKRAVAEQRHLRAVLGDEPQVTAELSGAELDHLLNPAHYLGQAKVWVERAVAEHNALTV
jgi:adenylosuccinate lyase